MCACACACVCVREREREREREIEWLTVHSHIMEGQYGRSASVSGAVNCHMQHTVRRLDAVFLHKHTERGECSIKSCLCI